jgi:methylated-DNA-[protein]-cysteine S-methyltransferase
MVIRESEYESPLGTIRLAVSDQGLCALCFAQPWDEIRQALRQRDQAVVFEKADPPADLRRSLDAYFAGRWHALDDVQVDVAGTPFQMRVWSALRRVPPGQTTSYAALGKAVGCGGARAIGAANAANPVCLVIPCHRVVRASGELGGYGAGVERKAWLLRHEGVPLDGGVVGRGAASAANGNGASPRRPMKPALLAGSPSAAL